MMPIKTFEQLLNAAREKGPKRVAIVFAHEPNALMAAHMAHEKELAECILIGDAAAIHETASIQGLNMKPAQTLQADYPDAAARRAVELVNAGEADLAMNGLAQPRYLIEAALDRKGGLRTGRLLTDVSLFEIPNMDRLILLSDIGIVVSPTMEQRIGIVRNAVEVAHALGIEVPKVAILAATEMVNTKIPLSMEAANLSKMAQRGQIKGALIDGPLALDNAISPEAARIKGIKSDVAGYADILIAPDIEAGNILAKTIIYFAKGKMASVVVGGRCPLVLPSRSDPPETKLISMALGIYLSE
jgi:phosphate butyryltransferase